MEQDINIELMTQIRLCENIIKRTKKNPNKTIGHGRILSVLSQGQEITQSQIADLLEIRPQSLTRVLSEMEEAGQIERKRDEADRRIVNVKLTEQGKKDFKKHKADRAKRAAGIFNNLNEEEKAQLTILLNKVIRSNNEKEGNHV